MIGLLLVVLVGWEPPPNQLPIQALDYMFMGAQEETIMGWTRPGNLGFLEAMPPKASRGIMKMWRSPNSTTRDDGQRELLECGPEWHFWALHIPSAEVKMRAQANLFTLSRCVRPGFEDQPNDHRWCSQCSGWECFWNSLPFLDDKWAADKRDQQMRQDMMLDAQQQMWPQ